MMRCGLRSESTAGSWCAVLLLLLPALLIAIDVSVLFIAGPAIAAALHPTSGQWLWAMDIYGFVLASLLITMGSLGDRFGRRRVLLAGATVFDASSAAVAYAPSAGWLIAARALMALGGATLAPSTLSLIRGMFPDEARRGRAVAAWTVAFAGGAIAGPIVGGALLAHVWWGAVFLINIPVVIVLLIFGPILIPEQRTPITIRSDPPSVVLSLVAVLGLVYPLTRISDSHHLDSTTAVTAVVGIAAAAAFLRRQRIAANPLIRLSLFRVPGFSPAVGANTLVAGVTAGVGLLAFPFMQLVHGLTPLQSALYALPTLGGAFAGPIIAGAAITRYRPASLLIMGLCITATGLTIVGAVNANTTLWTFIGGYSIITFGTGITATMGNAVILSSTPAAHAGAASGLSETSSQLGSALGIALLGSLANAVYRSTFTHTRPHGKQAWNNAATAVSLARSHGGLSAAALEPVRHAYTSAITTTAFVSAVITVVVAFGLAVLLRTRRSSPASAAAQGAADHSNL